MASPSNDAVRLEAGWCMGAHGGPSCPKPQASPVLVIDGWAYCGDCLIADVANDTLIVGVPNPPCGECGERAVNFYCDYCAPDRDHDYCHEECWRYCTDCDEELDSPLCDRCLEQRVEDQAQALVDSGDVRVSCDVYGCRDNAYNHYCEEHVPAEEQMCASCGDFTAVYCEDCAAENNNESYCEVCGHSAYFLFCERHMEQYIDERTNAQSCDTCGMPASGGYCDEHSVMPCQDFGCYQRADYNFCRKHFDEQLDPLGAEVVIAPSHAQAAQTTKPKINEDGTEIHDGDIVVRWGA